MIFNYFLQISRVLKFAMKVLNPFAFDKDGRKIVSRLFIMFVTVPACLCLFIGLYVNKRLDGIDMIDLTELAENAVIFLCAFRNLIYFIFLLLWSSRMELFLSRIISDRESSLEEFHLRSLTLDYCKKEFFVAVGFLIMSASALSFVISCILFFKVNEYHLPLRLFIVWWPINGPVNWTLNYCFQVLVEVFAGGFLVIYFPLTVALMNHSCWGFDVLTVLINELKSTKDNETDRFDEQLKNIVLRSYKILEYHYEAQELLRFNFLLEFSVLSFVFCLSLFTVAANANGSAVVYLVLQVTIAQLFLYCWVGTKFIKSVETLQAAVYNVRWFELNVTRRKMIHLMLVMVQHVKGFNGIFNQVGMDTFQKILEFTFKLYTLMKSIY